MQSVLIDDCGHSWPASSPKIIERVRSLSLDKDVIGYAVSKLGFIHIRSVNRSIVVSLWPELVHPTTMVAAFYTIADLQPERIVVCTDTSHQGWELFSGVNHALNQIDRLVAAATARRRRRATTRRTASI